MSIYALKIISALLCFIYGSLATFSLQTIDVDSVRFLIVSIISLGCLPLGGLITYDLYLDTKP